jgi:glycosyltransferase involved in cell wall biosynthesis
MTCGEETEKECLEAFRTGVRAYPDKVTFQEVRNITPASVALNKMFDLCKTKYLVPLDADMILYLGFMERITSAIDKHPSGWHSLLFPLWDTLTARKIMALKVFDMDIIKNFRYQDDPCPDIKHYKDLDRAGYKAVNLMEEQPIGDHVVRGNFFCYAKYRDLYMVTRSHPETILESHFIGGRDLKSRAKNHFDFFSIAYQNTGNVDYLYCISGMVEGLTNPLTHKSKDLSDTNMRISLGNAENIFKSWYNKNRRIFM